MQQRPIGILVDAMRTLGAKIDYVEQDGYPPLRIKGGFEQKTDLVSSVKVISAVSILRRCCLIAARLPQGLRLRIEGDLTSRPYVEMTLSMLQQAGIQHQWEDNSHQHCQPAFCRNQIFGLSQIGAPHHTGTPYSCFERRSRVVFTRLNVVQLTRRQRNRRNHGQLWDHIAI
jgi:hypothetical protein